MKRTVTLLSLILSIYLSGCGGAGDKKVDTPEAVNLAAYQAATAQGQSDPVVARVNGQEIRKSAVLAVLLRGRGKTVLDELILLEVVRQRAREAGIEIKPSLAQEERQRVLEEMGPGKSTIEQEGLLEFMLKSRGLTQQEFDLMLERQALLRRLVDERVEISDEELAKEYERQHGRRVVVRHLAVNNLHQMEKVIRRLQAGEDFAVVTQEMSQDEVTLSRGGLWGPFSAADEQIPQAIRQAAQGLDKIGQRSEVIHYQDEKETPWWCLVQLEEVIEADGMAMKAVREELSRDIRQREIGRRMFALQKELKSKARIEILDPILQKDDDN